VIFRLSAPACYRKKHKDRLAVLARLVMAQSAHRKIEEERDFGSAVLSPIWASQKTPWPVVEALLNWVQEADKCDTPTDLLALALSGDDQFCTLLANELDRQLPPTNFFKMVSANEDGEEDEALPLPGRTRDFESVLKLGCAQDLPERMLRWHYPSRHPSLIAPSNKECYGGRLLLPPSPLSSTEELGLSFVASPSGHYDRGGSGRNPAEADLIAAAVERHMIKWPQRSLGLACFSVAQRDVLEDSLHQRGVLAAAEAFAPRGERQGDSFSRSNATERPITAPVRPVTGIGSGKRFLKGSVGSSTGFGAPTGLDVPNCNPNGCSRPLSKPAKQVRRRCLCQIQTQPLV
jgi:hypothetical protein